MSSDYSIVNASVLEADDAFVGFSYAPPSEDLFLWTVCHPETIEHWDWNSSLCDYIQICLTSASFLHVMLKTMKNVFSAVCKKIGHFKELSFELKFVLLFIKLIFKLKF